MLPQDCPGTLELANGLRVEDHSTEFYLVLRSERCDMTVSLDGPVAEALARFILQRRGSAVVGSSESLS
jgi:hypothetical protein